MSQWWISSRSELNSPFSCFPLHSFLEGKLLLLTAKLCVLLVFSFSFLFLCCPISCSIFCFHALFTFTAFYCLFLLVFHFYSSPKFFSPHLPGFHFNFFSLNLSSSAASLYRHNILPGRTSKPPLLVQELNRLMLLHFISGNVFFVCFWNQHNGEIVTRCSWLHHCSNS